MPNRFLITNESQRYQDWLIVYGFNLVIPGVLGWLVTTGDAQLGMAVGIVLCWYVGFMLNKRSAWLGTALKWGGIIVGLSQCIFKIHFFLGG